MKKSVQSIGVLIVALCLCMTMFACGDKKGGSDDNLPIAVQKAASADVETALRAYVADELALSEAHTTTEKDEQTGEDKEVTETRDLILAEYVGHEAKGEVTLALSKEDANGLISAEKYAVKVKIADLLYRKTTPVYEEATQTVYILKYGEASYKYAVYAPEIGERLTNSYYAYLSDVEKYAACVYTGIVKEQDKGDTAPVFLSGGVSKFGADALYNMSYYDEQRFNDRKPGGTGRETDSASYYAAMQGSVYYVYQTYDETSQALVWEVEPNEYKGTLDDITAMAWNRVFDGYKMPAMLVRTESGAKGQIIEPASGNSSDEVSVVVLTIDDGRITGITYESSYTVTDKNTDTSYIHKYIVERYLSDFGKAKVTVPKEVTDAIDAAKAQTPAE